MVPTLIFLSPFALASLKLVVVVNVAVASFSTAALGASAPTPAPTVYRLIARPPATIIKCRGVFTLIVALSVSPDAVVIV